MTASGHSSWPLPGSYMAASGQFLVSAVTLAEASPDLMRSLLQSIINTLLSGDADAVVGAEYGRPSPGRTAQGNGCWHRDLDTRVGTIDVAIPKLRTGTYFPEWLLERRQRAESALITVVADCYLAGVSTRRMDKLVKTLGIDSLSKSQVSRMPRELDAIVEDFRHRPLGDTGPFTFVTADAPTMKVREGGRVVNAVVLLAAPDPLGDPHIGLTTRGQQHDPSLLAPVPPSPSRTAPAGQVPPGHPQQRQCRGRRIRHTPSSQPHTCNQRTRGTSSKAISQRGLAVVRVLQSRADGNSRHRFA